MKHARDLLDPHPLTTTPDVSVPDLARKLIDAGADGACVVDGDRLVGVVTSMDLIFQEKRVQLPSIITIMDLVIPIGMRKAEAELERISGATVGEIMSTPPKTVSPEAGLDEVATLMVDQHITIVPVVEDGRLVGVVSKPSILAAAFGRAG